jgi:CRISPR-associated protein Csd1
MILKALADYYERMQDDPKIDIAPPGFEKKAIPFLIVIDKQGCFVNIRDTRSGTGKDKTVREFLLPQGMKKASGIKANLFWDNPQYVLGSIKPGCQDEKDLKKAAKSLSAFKKRIEETCGCLTGNEGLQAVRHFLTEEKISPLFEHDLWPEIWLSNANLTFLLEGTNSLVVQDKQLVKQITNHSNQSGKKQICSISGINDTPATLHTAIKGVWGAQTAGGNIVSFNKESFCSFNKWKQQGLNAPVSQKYEFAYTTALNIMLKKGSRQRMQIGDTSTVFWAKEKHTFEEDFSCFLAEPPKGEEADYAKFRSLLNSVKNGVFPLEDDIPFYVLGIAPNAARLAIRFWYEGSISNMKEKIAQHFEDIKIIRAPHDREFLSLFQLLKATAIEGKADNIPPNQGGEITRAVMSGSVYPRTLFAGAIRRCKAEQKVTHARAALIKGFLVREKRLRRITTKEVKMALDKTNENTGYVLGRLFAVLERIQEQALTGINKTIRDTYFSAATSNPVVIFKRLQDLAIHHLAKMRNNGKNTTWLDKLMQEVIGKLSAEGIPNTLTLEDQGRFAIGYYHQRQDFFIKNEDKTTGE